MLSVHQKLSIILRNQAENDKLKIRMGSIEEDDESRKDRNESCRGGLRTAPAKLDAPGGCEKSCRPGRAALH
jgi:hypothetical protein